MASSKLSAILFGYGPRAGAGIVKKLVNEGYTVAAGNRHPDAESAKRDGYHAFHIDLRDADGFAETAGKVRREVLGADGYFNVVIYNGYDGDAIKSEIPGNPLSLDLKTFKTSMDTEINSAYAAILFANEGFDKLPKTSPRVYIGNGNATPFIPAMPVYLTLFLGKRSQSYLAEYLATHLSPKTGAQFYYAFQVASKENPVPPAEDMSGEAHGLAFFSLINNPSQQHWQVRFDKTGALVEVPK